MEMKNEVEVVGSVLSFPCVVFCESSCRTNIKQILVERGKFIICDRSGCPLVGVVVFVMSKTMTAN